jgi:hypothetical protein
MYGTPLQDQFCRLNRMISVVFALFRENEGRTEVLLRLRKPHEPYGGEYCPEANVCLPKETEDKLIARMLRKLGVIATKIVHLSPADFSIDEERQCEWKHCVYFVQVDGEPSLIDGRGWFPLEEMPENIVKHHRVAIETGLAYRENPSEFDDAMKAAKEAIGL